MKVLLIYPYCLDNRIQGGEIRVAPIGVYYVAALLKENHYDVEILNWHDINRTPGKIDEILSEKKPDIIGFSILQANRWGGIEISQIAKRIDPDVKIVFGGIGATFLWEHFLTRFKDIDFVVLGEGEYPFLNLARCIETEDYDNLEHIKGIAFRKKGSLVKTKDPEFIQDLDTLPDPAKYFVFQHVSSTRGCPWDCTFCGSPQFWRRKVRLHSPEYFVGQLEALYNRGIRFFYVSDDTFTIDKTRVIEICKEIIARNLEIGWMAISRVNYVNEEVIYWMRKAGCVQISYGVESGSEKIRNGVLKKNIDTEQIKMAFELTIRYGILARAYFIYGSPGESWATIEETLDLIYEIRPLSTIFYILDIFPGTQLYADFLNRSGLDEDIWLEQIEDIMYFQTDPHLSQELILAFGERLRTDYHKTLPDFILGIELADRKDLYKMHADFLSRLAMTFTHGDYANNKAIEEKGLTAEGLYTKALDYYPDHRAYLGLGILRQKHGKYRESIELMREGVGHFPESEAMHISMGMSYMNLGAYHEALSCLLKFKDSSQAAYHIAACYKALGNHKMEAAFREKASSDQDDI